MPETPEPQREITVGQMLKMAVWPPGPPSPDRLVKVWRPQSEGFPVESPALARLERIARHEWGEGLDPERFSLLVKHLQFCCRHHDGSDVSSGEIEAMNLDEAAEGLESIIGSPPCRKLLDLTLGACLKCGGTLDEKIRAQRQGWCDDCRSNEGRMRELDLAIKTGVGERYSQAGNDPLESFPEWQELSTILCEKYNILRVNRDAWDRFCKWYKHKHQIGGSTFLLLKRTEVLDRLRSRDASPSRDPNPETTPIGSIDTEGRAAKRAKKPRDQNKSAICVGIYFDAVGHGKTPPTNAEIARQAGCRPGYASRVIKEYETKRKYLGKQDMKDRYSDSNH